MENETEQPAVELTPEQRREMAKSLAATLGHVSQNKEAIIEQLLKNRQTALMEVELAKAAGKAIVAGIDYQLKLVGYKRPRQASLKKTAAKAPRKPQGASKRNRGVRGGQGVQNDSCTSCAPAVSAAGGGQK